VFNLSIQGRLILEYYNQLHSISVLLNQQYLFISLNRILKFDNQIFLSTIACHVVIAKLQVDIFNKFITKDVQFIKSNTICLKKKHQI